MTTWGVGDYPLMAAKLEPAARCAVDAAFVLPGDRVLDVATGTGNAALLAAAQGGDVVGVDFEPSLLQVAERRAEHRALRVRWANADLERLPLSDASSEVVLSVFGVMYAQNYAVAAGELARVAAPDARVVIASWTPGSVMADLGEVVGDYLGRQCLPSVSPTRWGDADWLHALLASSGLRLGTLSRRDVVLSFEDADSGADFLFATAGHLVSERQHLIAAGRLGALHRDLAAFVKQRSEPRDGQLDLGLEYLLATASRQA
ncbi:MAG: Methyltransferase type 11 [Acidimicrobiaceae bacterium]|nr:Methyltransferase type 11 [Acidimicrobiaceae bacterium]